MILIVGEIVYHISPIDPFMPIYAYLILILTFILSSY